MATASESNVDTRFPARGATLLEEAGEVHLRASFDIGTALNGEEIAQLTLLRGGNRPINDMLGTGKHAKTLLTGL
jgi:hypothetical protein